MFYPRSINAVYTKEIYLLQGKNLCKYKCLLLLKTSSVWLGGCSLDTFQSLSSAEQLPFPAAALSANPHEGFAEICSCGQGAAKDPFCFPGGFREEKALQLRCRSNWRVHDKHWDAAVSRVG